jgi:hypothetical protein
VIAYDYITQWSVGAPWPQRRVMERLGARLKNAPSSAEIANGAWRE